MTARNLLLLGNSYTAAPRIAPLVLLMGLALSEAAFADRQMDPELRGVIAEALQPTDCYADRYELSDLGNNWY